jgi:hypothetical protein
MTQNEVPYTARDLLMVYLLRIPIVTLKNDQVRLLRVKNNLH